MREFRGLLVAEEYDGDDEIRFVIEGHQTLMEYGEASPDDEDDEQAAPVDLGANMPAGPARKVACAVSPGDFAYVRGGKSGSATPYVLVEVTADGETSQVALSVANARAYAAAILDAADEAEGGSPLLMFRSAEKETE